MSREGPAPAFSSSSFSFFLDKDATLPPPCTLQWCGALALP